MRLGLSLPVVLLIDALLLQCVFSKVYAPDDPLPAPAAIVLVGNNTRVTVLTPTLVRIDQKEAGQTVHDDRPTFTVVNRHLPVPAFSVTLLNATASLITTEALEVTVNDQGVRHGNSCALPAQGMDADSPTNSPTYPSGVVYPNGTLQSLTQAQCCGVCDSDPHCLEYVWATDVGNCWPLADSTGRHAAVNRSMGGSTSRAAGISITFVSPTTGMPVTWTPASAPTSNLNGTYAFLDCYGMSPMECNAVYDQRMGLGLLSGEGWAALDDARTARMVPAPSLPGGLAQWWALDSMQPVFDVYFQATPTLDYKAALAEWASVLGRPALLPRSAFGVWWSHYHNYTQTTIVEEVLQGYANFSLPLNYLCFDMDWHNEPNSPGCATWGNYDPSPFSFPDLPGFAAGVHEHGSVIGSPLKISLNLHPDAGVDHCDTRYPAIASAMGIDPVSNATVQCDFGNATFFDALMSVYIDAEPLRSSMDVVWSDYNGCGVSGGNPMLWSNLALWGHMKARGLRGHAFSRFGGLGNHRAPMGFSGDCFQHEVALYHQVKTTQTAANVLWGYWSHDIGAFHDGSQGGTGMAEAPGDHDPTNVTGSELLLRWIQFGVVSPVFRTHCNHCERRIWMFPYHFEQMRDAMQLRNALGPYLYTEARAFFDTAVAPVHPLYYEEPRNAALYAPSVVERVFMHGDRLLAAPITTMTGDPNGTLPWDLYLPDPGGPPGNQWSNWDGTATHDSGPLEGGVFGLGDIPLFVRGGILPLKTMASVAGNFPDPLVWALFPGSAAGGYTLYEDDGDSDAYRGGEYVTQAVNFTRTGGAITLTTSPAAATGALPPGFPSARSLVVQVRGMAVAPRQVQVNGVGVPEAAEGVVPGWYLVGGGGGHSPLLLPQGTLVVSAGQQSSWDVTVVNVLL